MSDRLSSMEVLFGCCLNVNFTRYIQKKRRSEKILIDDKPYISVLCICMVMYPVRGECLVNICETNFPQRHASEPVCDIIVLQEIRHKRVS